MSREDADGAARVRARMLLSPTRVFLINGSCPRGRRLRQPAGAAAAARPASRVGRSAHLLAPGAGDDAHDCGAVLRNLKPEIVQVQQPRRTAPSRSASLSCTAPRAWRR